jgi:hypothetical protein
MELSEFNKLVVEEIDRQIDISVRYDSSLDQKIGIFLGFIVLVFAQVIILGNFSLKLPEPLSGLYILGSALLLGSIIIGAMIFTSLGKGTDFIGADVTKLIEDYDKGEAISPTDDVKIGKLGTLANNFEIIEHKEQYSHYLIYLFVAAMVVLTILTIIAHC